MTRLRSRERLGPDRALSLRAGSGWLEKLALVLVSGLVYGLTIAAVGMASPAMPPLVLTTLRLAIASGVFAILLCLRRPAFRWQWRRALDIAAVGLLNVAVTFVALAMAVRYISSSLAAVLFNTTPVFTLVMAHWLFADEKLNAGKALGGLVAVIGATLLLISNASGLAGGNGQAWIGQALIIGAALANAVAVIYARLRLREEDPMVLAAGQVFASLLVVAPLALVTGGALLASYPLRVWGAVLVAGLGAPVIGFWLLFYMINKYSASLGGFASIATPLFSALIGTLALGEVFTGPMVVGTALLLAGILTVSFL